ncbi:MRN complex-interacting protein-like isoform X2 [Asterias rubens]|uniref:MRN complex-interacting protein-like isoform X2 n=1 Tax=Asterias rubens TaxID=7604 RepID=UPI0014550281|nr:MRN complex-interacting protein-like isoform X2 [Asterias rubens]
MPQEFHVVRCYACEVFQVQQVKKISKWQCKMCGEKQSLKKVYGRGTGSDCRRHVQKLNMTAGESRDTPGGSGSYDQSVIPNCVHRDEEPRVSQDRPCFEKPKVEKGTSKWKTFMNDEEEVEDDETPGSSFQEATQHPYLDNVEVTLSRPERQRRGGRKNGGWDSGRKRKRDLDQDTPEYPSGQQNRNTSFRNVKPSDVNNEENVLPRVPYPHCQVANASHDTSKITDGVKFTEESGASAGDLRLKPTQNHSTTCGETKKLTTKPKPEASSKWGQFLQDEEEEEEEEEDSDFQNSSTTTPTWSNMPKALAVDFRLKPKQTSTTCRETKKATTKTKPETSSKWGQFLQDEEEEEEEEEEEGSDFQSSTTRTQTWSRDVPNVNNSLQHHYNDTSCGLQFRYSGQLTENQGKPHTYPDGLARQATSIEVKPLGSYTAGDVTEKNQNQGANMAIFSIQDENLLDFGDEW